MAFKYQDYAGSTGPYTAEEAVARQVEHASHGHDGQLERLQARVEKLTEIVGRLIAHVDQRDVARVIGYSWEDE